MSVETSDKKFLYMFVLIIIFLENQNFYESHSAWYVLTAMSIKA